MAAWRWQFFAAGVLGSLLMLPGCDSKTQEPAEKKPWQGKITLVTGDWKQFQELVKSHRGKVVVADLWATWCEPCVKELPNLAKLQNKYGDQIVCIAVNLDYNGTKGTVPDVLRDNVKKTIRKRLQSVLTGDDELHPAFRLFICTQAAERVYDLEKIDSVPTIFVYSRTGRRSVIDVNSTGGKDPSYAKHVIPVVEKYLQEPNHSK